MSELKPCPFCGGKAKFVHIFENLEKCMVSCRECDGGIDAVFASEDVATEYWNRRAQPANEPLTLEELRGMDGEPVWSEVGSYGLVVDVVGAEVWLTDGSGERANAAGWIKHTKDMGPLYRRKPERSEDK